MAAISFSSPDSTLLYENVDKEHLFNDDIPVVLSESDIIETFEVERCIKWIQSNNYKKVSLQFPDHLLHISDTVALNIQQGIANESTVYILADTSYGSCCVDEVGAEHVASDAIIHFGASCLTPSSRLPVLFVFGNKAINCNTAVRHFSKHFTDTNKHVIVMFDVIYNRGAESIYQSLLKKYNNIVFSKLVIPGDEEKIDKDVCYLIVGGRRIQLKSDEPNIENYVVFYIGHEGQTLTNLLMILNKCEFLMYDPLKEELRQETVNVNKALQRRYYLIERARDARLVGILVGTLGVAGYLDVIDRMKKVGKCAGKKTYTIVVGRLNPIKLANFPEIDVFVLITCPENSLLDSRDFYRPIVTPFEFEVACNEARQWTGEYVTDFRELLPGSIHYAPLNTEGGNVEPQTSVSLISGKINQLGVDSNVEESSINALIATNRTLAISQLHSNAGGEFLANRSWQGLEQNLGKNEVATIQEGKSGTAAGYEHESKLVDKD